MHLVVIADTHLTGGVVARLSPALLEAIDAADLVLHAGDITNQVTLDELSARAPIQCVLGNNDSSLVGVIPAQLLLSLAGVEVAMVHDSGSRAGRAARLAARFPSADLVIYGHSHVPDDSEGVNGQRLFNPGSPTQRRAQPFRTFGEIELEDGKIRSHEIRSIKA